MFRMLQNAANLIHVTKRIYYVLSFLPVFAYRYIPERKDLIPHKVHTFVVGIEKVPHHVLVVYGSKYCSGSLTGSRMVLTTASCFIKRRSEEVIVKVGANTMIDFGQIIPVLEIKTHEYYRQLCDLDNDVALLLLRDHVNLGKVKKTIIVDSEVALRIGTRILVAGWGSANLQANHLNLLLQSEMLVMDKTACQNVFGGLITSSNFCAKYTRDQRLSDNGGSAVFNDVLVGMLSAGGTSINEPYIAILTNVSYFHRWIVLNTKKFLKKYCVVRKDYAEIVLDSDEYHV